MRHLLPLCHTGIYLANGTVTMQGDIKTVTDAYLADCNALGIKTQK